MKICPYCAEQIQDEAIVCRYCHMSLDPEQVELIQSSLSGKDGQPVESVGAGEKDAKTPGSSGLWMKSVLVGLFASVLASIGDLASLTSLGSGDVAPATARGMIQTLAFHFVLGVVIYSLGAAFGIWLWRKSKLAFLMAAGFVGLVILGFVLAPYWQMGVRSLVASPVSFRSVATSTLGQAKPETPTSRPSITPQPWMPNWAPLGAFDIRSMYQHVGETGWVCGAVYRINLPDCWPDCWPPPFTDFLSTSGSYVRVQHSSYDIGDNVIPPGFWGMSRALRFCAYGTIQAETEGSSVVFMEVDSPDKFEFGDGRGSQP